MNPVDYMISETDYGIVLARDKEETELIFEEDFSTTDSNFKNFDIGVGLGAGD